MRSALFFLTIVVSVFASFCGESRIDPQAATVRSTGVGGGAASIDWIDSAKNYGKILEGQKLAISFRFRNSGTEPLIIESVTPTCGCTVADFPKQPIAPGKEGEISGEFDSNGREGLQHKQLTVKTNAAKPMHTISFDVNVIKKSSP